MNTIKHTQLRILVADDEPSTLKMYEKVFSLINKKHRVTPETEKVTSKIFEEYILNLPPLEFELVMCRQGDEAVDAVKKSLEENRHFAVAFLDVHMPPGPDGIWTAEHIRALDPYVEIVIVTGYSDVYPGDIISRVPPVHKLLYLQKPLDHREISQSASALGVKWYSEHEFRKVHEELAGWLQERTGELMDVNEQLNREIQERKRIEENLRRSEERRRIVLETTPDPVVVYNVEGEVNYCNPAFSRVFGWTMNETVGRNIDFIPGEKLPETRLLFEKISRGETISGIETCRLTRNQQRIDVSISGAGFFDRQGNLQGSVITFQDITERKRTEEEIRYIAYHDILTGLPNRKSFYMRLEDELVRSGSKAGGKRRGEAHKWALLFLDLDRFKYVNDTLGHDAGDELLKLVGNRIQNCLRKSDRIFRLAGDEFTIILTDLTDNTDVAKVCKKIREEVAQPCDIREHELYVTISIGISIYPDDGDSVERLVKNADMAMYSAKEEGRGYRFFTEEMNNKALQRLMLESSLRNALQQDQFMIYYQPLVDNKNRIIGMEALLRWNHPELGLLTPSQFIPVAEETGAIIPIGKWVLFSACKQGKKWHEMGHTEFYVCVNLSARQFREPDLVETIEQVLESTGLPPNCLELEVTESGIMENPEQAAMKMGILREKGIHFSIDDFGTGYSSLAYLKRFPIDMLKIDRSFVIDSMKNEDDQEIIKMFISVAQNLHMDTMAEGVETKEQQEFLIRQGCHMMQGYYLGKPMPAQEFEEMLLSRETK